MSAPRPLLVAVDGPAGSGKGTVARSVARRLGIPYYDTGAMYRALALAVVEAGVDPDDPDAVARVLGEHRVSLRPPRGAATGGDVAFRVLLDDEPVEERIRTPEVGDATSRIAVHPPVRRFMVELQRAYGRSHGGVMEGRDIGSRVFPEAPVKIFLDADPEVRAERRYRQLREAGEEIDREQALADVRERDRRDAGRRDSPLVCDDSYVRIDTSERGIEEAVEAVLEAVRRAMA